MSDLALPHNDLAANLPLVAGSPFETRLGLTAPGVANAPATGYGGTEDLSAVFIPGPGLPAAWTPAVAWESPFDAADPGVILSWAEGTTSAVDPGSYYCLLTVAGASLYVGLVSIIGGVDVDGVITPTPLISVDEFKARVGSWPESLQTATTATGLRRTLALATSELYEAIADRYAGPSSLGWGTTAAARRSEMLASLATPGNLAVSEPMKAFVAYRALYHLCKYKPAGGRDTRDSFGVIAMRAEWDAERALRRVAAVVEGHDGVVYLGGPTRLIRG